MTFVNAQRVWILLGLSAILGCGKSLDKQIRDQIRTVDNASLPKDAVEVGKVQESGGYVLAEVTVKTQVKLKKQGDTYLMEEVRLGDRRWESVDLIVKALNQERIKKTENDMALIAAGINSYATAHGEVPQGSDFRQLIDLLTPQYLASVIRLDPWWNPFQYQASGKDSFVLRSAGPDATFGTEDDLVLSKSL